MGLTTAGSRRETGIECERNRIGFPRIRRIPPSKQQIVVVYVFMFLTCHVLQELEADKEMRKNVNLYKLTGLYWTVL